MSHHSARLLRCSTIGVILTSIAVALPLSAQRGRAGTDSALRADYRDLGELLSKLPAVTPPPFDEAHALWLGALPLSCLDRLQPRPGRGGAARGAVIAFNPTADSSSRVARPDTNASAAATGGVDVGGIRPSNAARRIGGRWTTVVGMVP